MRIAFKCFLFTIFICFQIQSFGQLDMADIKLEQIHQRTIRKYIECQIGENKHQFSEIHPSWTKGKDLSGYSKNEMTFLLKDELQDVWQGYLSADPSKSWTGRMVSFGLLLQKFPGNIFYNHDLIMGVDTGQVCFLNLKLLLGIFNVPVAFEIITVDPVEKVIEFSYIEGNKSSGVQHVKFLDIGGGCTEIVHTSYFKSDSHLRDKWLYPFFHEKIVNGFHYNMKKLLHAKKEKIKKQAIITAFNL
jgi:hypothetical protein